MFSETNGFFFLVSWHADYFLCVCLHISAKVVGRDGLTIMILKLTKEKKSSFQDNRKKKTIYPLFFIENIKNPRSKAKIVDQQSWVRGEATAMNQESHDPILFWIFRLKFLKSMQIILILLNFCFEKQRPTCVAAQSSLDLEKQKKNDINKNIVIRFYNIIWNINVFKFNFVENFYYFSIKRKWKALLNL